MTQQSNDELLSEAHDALLDELTALREIKLTLLGLQIAATDLDEGKYAEHLLAPMNRVLGGDRRRPRQPERPRHRRRGRARRRVAHAHAYRGRGGHGRYPHRAR